MGQFNAELHKAVTQIIDQLPQRKLIADSTAARWVEEVIKLEGERAIWHAHRASTIGGSEAGEFLLAAMGERPAYNSLDQIWRQKMLIDLPERPNIYMRRGTAMEDLANRVYLKLSGHKSVMDTDEIKNAFSRPHDQYPHMGGNPDEVVDANNLRVITDFKVRNKLDEEAGVSVVNGAQLHWYGLVHEGNLKKLPDGYCLAELDIPADMIDDLMANPPSTDEAWDRLADEVAAINRPGFGMKTQYFKHNAALASNLVRLTQQWWDKYVMTGTPYVKPKPDMPKEMTDIDKKRVEEAQNRITKYKLAENAAKENGQKARSDIDKVVKQYDISDWPFEAPGVSAGFSKKFDKEAAAKDLIAAGVDRDSLCKASESPDVDRMVQTLEQHGLMAESHYKPTWDTRTIKEELKANGLKASDYDVQNLRIGLSQKKADAPIREILEKRMGQHIEEFMEETDQPETVDSLTDLDPATDQEDEQTGLKLA